MAPKAREPAKGPVERLHERIATRDTGWFFAQIADRVAERRTAMGLSQRDLAERCGTTQSAIARLERGGRPPRIDTLLRIATPDERSQWQWWAAQADPSLEFRTSAVYGERTDQIARRLDLVLGGADVLVVQGGINDVVQRRPLEEAAGNIEAML